MGCRRDRETAEGVAESRDGGSAARVRRAVRRAEAVTRLLFTALDLDFLVRIIDREIKRAQRRIDPTYVPEKGMRDANLSRVAHLHALRDKVRAIQPRDERSPHV